jgi:hypothetical protein
MRVKALVDHFNDYSLNGSPASAVGEDRRKAKGAEYDIPDDDEAKRLIDAEIVEKVAAKK